MRICASQWIWNSLIILKENDCSWSVLDLPWCRVCLCVSVCAPSQATVNYRYRIWYEKMLTFYIPPFQAVASVRVNKYLTAESCCVDVSFGICIVFFHDRASSWYMLRPNGFIVCVLHTALIDHDHCTARKWVCVEGRRSQVEGVYVVMCAIVMNPHTSRTVWFLLRYLA